MRKWEGTSQSSQESNKTEI